MRRLLLADFDPGELLQCLQARPTGLLPAHVASAWSLRGHMQANTCARWRCELQNCQSSAPCRLGGARALAPAGGTRHIKLIDAPTGNLLQCLQVWNLFGLATHTATPPPNGYVRVSQRPVAAAAGPPLAAGGARLQHVRAAHGVQQQRLARHLRALAHHAHDSTLAGRGPTSRQARQPGLS